MAKVVKIDQKQAKTFDEETVLRFSRKMVYRVEKNKIGCKKIQKVENGLKGTKWGLRYPKEDAIYVKRVQNWLKQ